MVLKRTRIFDARRKNGLGNLYGITRRKDKHGRTSGDPIGRLGKGKKGSYSKARKR